VRTSNSTSVDDRAKETLLITRCQAGDTNAFRQLVERHQQYVFALAFRVVCDEDDAKDIVQETFIRVWGSMHTFDRNRKFTTWLFRIAVNLAYDRMRRGRRKNRLFASWSAADERSATANGNDLESAVANRDLAGKIKSLTAGLSPKQRIVFILRDLQEMPMDEIADSLGMSMSSVKANLCYARRKIRRELEPMTE